MRHAATRPCVALALTANACTNRTNPAEGEGISFERNSEFQGPHLRVFVTLQDGSVVSVNTADDSGRTRPAETPIPCHQARDWTFIKDTGEGIAVAYALASWDGNDPVDYLMAAGGRNSSGRSFPDCPSPNPSSTPSWTARRSTSQTRPPERPQGPPATKTKRHARRAGNGAHAKGESMPEARESRRSRVTGL